MLHVGVDLAETQPRQICIMDDNRIVKEFRVLDGASGLGEWLKEIDRREPDKAQVVVAVERPDGPFVGGLLDAGYTVYPIDPKAIERYRVGARGLLDRNSITVHDRCPPAGWRRLPTGRHREW